MTLPARSVWQVTTGPDTIVGGVPAKVIKKIVIDTEGSSTVG